MCEIRRFTKEDWYGWAGATRFKNGSEPFIFERPFEVGTATAVVIGDATGVYIHLLSEEDPDDSEGTYVWVHSRKNLTPLQVEGELRAILKKLEKFPYAADLSYELYRPYEKEFKDFEWIGTAEEY